MKLEPNLGSFKVCQSSDKNEHVYIIFKYLLFY